MTTTVGVHRDDIAITIDGKEARTFASQGQQRSAVLSLKLAQLELAGAESGEAPILMLDDVMSELDEQRRRALVKFVSGDIQTFITTANLAYFDEDLLAAARVVRLPLERKDGE